MRLRTLQVPTYSHTSTWHCSYRNPILSFIIYERGKVRCRNICSESKKLREVSWRMLPSSHRILPLPHWSSYGLVQSTKYHHIKNSYAIPHRAIYSVLFCSVLRVAAVYTGVHWIQTSCPTAMVDSRTINTAISLVAATFGYQTVEFQEKAIQFFSQTMTPYFAKQQR